MLIVIGFSVLCLIFPSLAWAGYLVYRQTQLKRAIGKFVLVEDTKGVSSSQIEFALPDGQRVLLENKDQSSEESSGELDLIFDLLNTLYRKYILRINLNEDEVLVYYNPNNPGNARTSANDGLILAPIALFLMGVCIILYAIPATTGFIQAITNSQ